MTERDQEDQSALVELEEELRTFARRDQRWKTLTQIPVVAFALGAPLFVSTIAITFNLGGSSLVKQSDDSASAAQSFGPDIDRLIDEVQSIMMFGFAICLIAAIAIGVMGIRHSCIKGRLRQLEAKHARLISNQSPWQ